MNNSDIETAINDSEIETAKNGVMSNDKNQLIGTINGYITNLLGQPKDKSEIKDTFIRQNASKSINAENLNNYADIIANLS